MPFRAFENPEAFWRIGKIRIEAWMKLFDLRFQQATRQLSNSHRFKEARIQLAQLLTVQNERLRSKASS